MAITKQDRMREESKQKLEAAKRERAKVKLINDNKLPRELEGKPVAGVLVIERKKHGKA